MKVPTGPGSDDAEGIGARQPHYVEPRFPALVEAVAAALVEAADADDPLEVARDCGQLLEALHQQVLAVQSRRDSALMRLLQSSPTTSHYALAQELEVSRQRIDQLAARVKAMASGQNAEQRSGA